MGKGCTDIVQGKCQFYGRLKKCIGHLNGFFVQLKMPVVGLKGMGGVGKTVLPLIQRNDHYIKGSLDNNSIFITLSQISNLQKISETVWERIDGKKMQKVQSLEDWHMLQPILMQPYETLVILDDVWSRTNLEYLLFEGPGYQTSITSRESCTILRSVSNQLHPLPFFCRKDALSLFCVWGFGQASIPTFEDPNLLKEASRRKNVR